MSQRPVSRVARVPFRAARCCRCLLHFHLLVPIGLVAWIYGGRQEAVREAQKAEEVDVEFRTSPRKSFPRTCRRSSRAARSARAAEAAARAPRRTSKPEPQRRRPRLSKPTDEAKQVKQPEPEVVEPPPKPAPKPEPRAHEKMVDLDNEKEVEPPPDAKYLAQKNNRADEETRATDTNLQKAQKGEARRVGQVGSRRHRARRGQAEDRRARGQEVRARAQGARRHARTTIRRSRSRQKDETRKSLLALRDPAKQSHELTPETVESVAAPRRRR